jgi:hypothetical protein
MRLAWIVAAGLLAGCAAEPPCKLPDGRRMLRAELLFGRDGVSDAAWDAFVRDELTRAFPDGLTILSGQGQWREPTGALLREPSQLVLVLLDADGAEMKLAAATYERELDQQSVAIALSPACVAF